MQLQLVEHRVTLGGSITDETLFGGTGVVTGSTQITNM